MDVAPGGCGRRQEIRRIASTRKRHRKARRALEELLQRFNAQRLPFPDDVVKLFPHNRAFPFSIASSCDRIGVGAHSKATTLRKLHGRKMKNPCEEGHSPFLAHGESHTRKGAKPRLAGKDGFASFSRVSRPLMAGYDRFAKHDGIERRVCKEMWRRMPVLQKILAANDTFATRNPLKPLQTRHCLPLRASFRRRDAKLSASQCEIFTATQKRDGARFTAQPHPA